MSSQSNIAAYKLWCDYTSKYYKLLFISTLMRFFLSYLSISVDTVGYRSQSRTYTYMQWSRYGQNHQGISCSKKDSGYREKKK